MDGRPSPPVALPETVESPESGSSAGGTEAGEIGGGPGTDEMAEAAFLAESRERGEVAATVPSNEAVAEEVDPKVLPPLEELVSQIPPDVREALDDLFRARFVAVKRIPRRALKT